ncbi:hypothetical protein C8Q80DRAFT_94684 [Daedaleopsis nitida]|nr:hypothetical protein C8Q80DRAFT_94684 [Daedaleopsis nitida]
MEKVDVHRPMSVRCQARETMCISVYLVQMRTTPDNAPVMHACSNSNAATCRNPSFESEQRARGKGRRILSSRGSSLRGDSTKHLPYRAQARSLVTLMLGADESREPPRACSPTGAGVRMVDDAAGTETLCARDGRKGRLACYVRDQTCGMSVICTALRGGPHRCWRRSEKSKAGSMHAHENGDGPRRDLLARSDVMPHPVLALGLPSDLSLGRRSGSHTPSPRVRTGSAQVPRGCSYDIRSSS